VVVTLQPLLAMLGARDELRPTEQAVIVFPLGRGRDVLSPTKRVSLGAPGLVRRQSSAAAGITRC
jgi:hypothetical protein